MALMFDIFGSGINESALAETDLPWGQVAI
jgi:hypothetical protein